MIEIVQSYESFSTYIIQCFLHRIYFLDFNKNILRFSLRPLFCNKNSGLFKVFKNIAFTILFSSKINYLLYFRWDMVNSSVPFEISYHPNLVFTCL